MANTTAVQYLEDLQSEVYASLGISAHDIKERQSGVMSSMQDDWEQLLLRTGPKDADVAAERKKLRQELERFPPPTPFEQTTWYRHIQTYLDEMEEAGRSYSETRGSREVSFEEAYDTKLRRPIVGTLPTGRLFPMTLKVPDEGGYLVAFDPDHLFLFALLLSKAVAQVIPPSRKKRRDLVGFSIEPKALRKALKKGKQGRKRFQELMLATLLADGPGSAEPYLLQDDSRTKLSQSLMISMESFLIGRELGHSSQGEYNEAGLARTDVQGVEVEEVLWTWAQGLWADLIGALLGIGFMAKRGWSAAFGYAGVELAFAASTVLGLADSILRTGEARDYLESGRRFDYPTDDPPDATRYVMLKKAMELRLGVAEMTFGDRVWDVVAGLWEVTRPSISQAYAEGSRSQLRSNDVGCILL